MGPSSRSLAAGQLEGLLAHAPHPIWATDLEGRFTMLNRAAQLVFGVREDDAIGRAPAELLPVALAARMTVQEREVREQMRSVVDELDEQHGGLLSATVVVRYPVLDEQGRLAAIGGMATDVGRERQATRELVVLRSRLRGAQRLASLGALAGGVAHDFNNVLLAISGYAELAQRSLPDESEARPCLSQVLAAVGRARRLVDRIASFGRVGEARRVPLRMLPLVREALDLLGVSTPPGVTVRPPRDEAGAGSSANDVTVIADGTQMLQVVMNLCVNALGAMPDGGELHLDLGECVLVQPEPAAVGSLAPGEWVVMVVTDTGLGMDEQVMSRIFERNFSTRPDGSGGLGLTVVRDIVLAHDGALRVASAPGRGSRFEVWLPAATDPAAAGAPATGS
jgi:PAS domain S-box-containing protein